MLQHPLGVELLGLGKEAGLGTHAHDRLEVAFHHGSGHLHLELHGPGRHPLEQAEVEKRHAAVV